MINLCKLKIDNVKIKTNEKHTFVEHDKYFNWLIGKKQSPSNDFYTSGPSTVSFFSTMIVSDKNAQ